MRRVRRAAGLRIQRQGRRTILLAYRSAQRPAAHRPCLGAHIQRELGAFALHALTRHGQTRAGAHHELMPPQFLRRADRPQRDANADGGAARKAAAALVAQAKNQRNMRQHSGTAAAILLKGGFAAALPGADLQNLKGRTGAVWNAADAQAEALTAQKYASASLYLLHEKTALHGRRGTFVFTPAAVAAAGVKMLHG